MPTLPRAPRPPQALLKAARSRAKGQPTDLKAAMQAACAAGNETVLRVLVQEGGFDVRRGEGGARLARGWGWAPCVAACG
jgi:hypothetical protein